MILQYHIYLFVYQYLMLAWQAPVSGHLFPTPLLAANTRTILVSGQLQLRTILSRPEGVRL